MRHLPRIQTILMSTIQESFSLIHSETLYPSGGRLHDCGSGNAQRIIGKIDKYRPASRFVFHSQYRQNSLSIDRVPFCFDPWNSQECGGMLWAV